MEIDALVTRIRRLAKLAAGLLVLLAYVWTAAVRLLPEVKRRKALRRGRFRR